MLATGELGQRGSDWDVGAEVGGGWRCVCVRSLPASQPAHLGPRSSPFHTPSAILATHPPTHPPAPRSTLVVTEECLLHPSRNPHYGKAGIEAVLKEYLGLEKIIWLWKGVAGDDSVVNGERRPPSIPLFSFFLSSCGVAVFLLRLVTGGLGLGGRKADGRLGGLGWCAGTLTASGRWRPLPARPPPLPARRGPPRGPGLRRPANIKVKGKGGEEPPQA